jgi:hypothetical protein
MSRKRQPVGEAIEVTRVRSSSRPAGDEPNQQIRLVGEPQVAVAGDPVE